MSQELKTIAQVQKKKVRIVIQNLHSSFIYDKSNLKVARFVQYDYENKFHCSNTHKSKEH